uniref:IBB domain-containing protein n=1 Tax=Nothoprocta perdicaria TaxID=30464 RepID=A0A8C6YU11_NOTPE
MWGWRRRRARAADELRCRRREREAALRKARRQEQLVSKRLLREEAADGRDGAESGPGALSHEQVTERPGVAPAAPATVYPSGDRSRSGEARPRVRVLRLGSS